MSWLGLTAKIVATAAPVLGPVGVIIATGAHVVHKADQINSAVKIVKKITS